LHRHRPSRCSAAMRLVKLSREADGRWTVLSVGQRKTRSPSPHGDRPRRPSRTGNVARFVEARASRRSRAARYGVAVLAGRQPKPGKKSIGSAEEPFRQNVAMGYSSSEPQNGPEVPRWDFGEVSRRSGGGGAGGGADGGGA